MLFNILLVIIILFVLIILIRTLLFKAPEVKNKEIDEVKFDDKKAIKSLQELVKCKTISYEDVKQEDNKEFEKLLNLLPKLYPYVCKKAKLKKFDGRGILFHIKGKDSNNPAIFMAHYDVVPVEEELWSKPAFKALIEDNIMWGRGTLDTKNTFNGVLFAANTLLEKGFVPKHDVYLAFSGCEETFGVGAAEMVKYFKKNNIEPSFVIDEGGAVVEGVFPGVKEACGLVGVAEKGCMDLKLSIKSNGGHASAPNPNGSFAQLAKACLDIESHPFKAHFNGPVAYMFDELGRRSSFLYRMIFANLWCFKPILDMICRKSGGQLNALVRTTTAFTQARGSEASNVIPPSAELIANVRINPNDSVDGVVEYARKVIKNNNIEISALNGSEPSRVSTIDSDGYRLIKEAIEDTWKGCVVAPYLMVQASDSRHYGEISDKVYRFSAADLTDEEIESIHGVDEHIRLDTIRRAVEFFIRVMREC